MYICIYRVYTHICKYRYMYIYIYIYMYICMYVYIYICICIYAYMYIFRCIYVYMYSTLHTDRIWTIFLLIASIQDFFADP